jgi:hypothetical protein
MLKMFCSKAIMLCLAAALAFSGAYAQPDVNSSFSNKMNDVFLYLEKNRVPDGLLLDYGMEFTNLAAFRGTALVDSNLVSNAAYWDVYQTLYTSRIHQNAAGWLHPDTLGNRWQAHRSQGRVALSGLFFGYARFRDDALSGGFLTLSGERFYDRYTTDWLGRRTWRNPYLNESVFVISSPIAEYSQRNLKVVLPAELWRTNRGSQVQRIEADFADGRGYNQVFIGQEVSLNYSSSGAKRWRFRLVLTNGQVLQTHTELTITAPAPVYATATSTEPGGISTMHHQRVQDEVIPIIARDAFLSRRGRCQITVRYANLANGIRRPLIFAEGYDPGIITAPEEQFGENRVERLRDRIDFGNQDLRNLLNQGYDIIYVDWDNGVDFIQRNAFVLQEVIRWVNNHKQPLPNGTFAQNVVVGESMGGLVARFALADMERRLPNERHQTGLYVSLDAPHQGANTPISYQHLARHVKSLYLQTGNTAVGIETIQWLRRNDILQTRFRNDWGELFAQSPFKIFTLSDAPASRQMLINYIDEHGNINNRMHDEWQTELRLMGYPTQCRNIAISNGSECARRQDFNAGQILLSINGRANTTFLGDILGRMVLPRAANLLNQPALALGFLPGRNDFNLDLVARAYTDGSSAEIYKMRLTFTKRILWTVPVTSVITDRRAFSNANILPYDNFPGGWYWIPFNFQSSEAKNFLTKHKINVSFIDRFTFVPVPSALDIGGGNVALTRADYLTSYIGANPPIPPRSTPFANFTTGFSRDRSEFNEFHTSLRDRTGGWLFQELRLFQGLVNVQPSTDCSTFCEISSISGSDNICNTSTVYTVPFRAGVNYQWTVDRPWLVSTQANGNNFTVTPIGEGTINVILWMTGGCINTRFSKTVMLGGSTANVSEIYPDWPGTQCYQPYALYNFYIDAGNIDNIAALEWGVRPSNTRHETILGDPNSLQTSVTAYFQNSGYHEVFVRPRNLCGTIGHESIYVVNVVWNCPIGWEMQASPNPATDELMITLHEDQSSLAESTNEDVSIELHDFYSSKPVRKMKFKKNQTEFKLDVRNLKRGMYVLSVTIGEDRKYKQVVLQ